MYSAAPGGVVLASTAGSLLGALVLYGAGTLVSPEGLAELLESRPMKLLGFRAEDAWKTIAWFQKKGQRAVLLGRCIPIIRSLISVPAGMAGMKMPGFLLYTIVGSTVWNLLLVGIGCSGRRCMGAGGRICEAICGCGFPYFNGGNRMLSGIPFI